MGGFAYDLTTVLQHSVLENLTSNYFLHTEQQTDRQIDTWNAD